VGVLMKIILGVNKGGLGGNVGGGGVWFAPENRTALQKGADGGINYVLGGMPLGRDAADSVRRCVMGLFVAGR